MTQSIPADDLLGEPNWPGNEGTATFVATEFHQRFVRVDPWVSTGTFVGGTIAQTAPGVATAANGLHYLSNGLSKTTSIPCEFVARRDGSAGPIRSMMWLDYEDSYYAQTDLTLSFVFALDRGTATEPLIVGNPPGSTTTSTGAFIQSRVSTGGAPPFITSEQNGAGRQPLVTFPGGITISKGPAITKPWKKLGDVNLPTESTGWEGTLLGFRLQGNQVLNDVLPMLYDDALFTHVDGYWVWIRPIGGLDYYSTQADLEVRLYSTLASNQTVTGVARRLLVHHTVTAGVTYLDLKAPFTVRVEVDNNLSGHPEIKLFISPWNGGGEQQLFNSLLPGTPTIPAGVTDVTVAGDGTVTDANATYKLTGDGTIAFGGYADRIQTYGVSGNQLDMREGLIAIESKKTDTGVVQMRDEFARVGISPFELPAGSGVWTVTDRFGNQGLGLEAMWYHGENAATDHFSGDISRQFIRAGPGATIFDPTPYGLIDPTFGVPPGIGTLDNRVDVASFRPADYDNSQHRRITFRPGAQNTANPNYVGAVFYFEVCLLGSASAGSVNFSIAATLLMTTTAGGAQQALIVSINNRSVASQPANPPTYDTILQQTLSSPPNLLDGADHTLEFDCHIFSEASGPSAPMVYYVAIDGTPVSWVAADVQPGKSITILSATDEAIDFDPPLTSGSVEAVSFHASNETDAGGVKLWDPWRIENWEQLTLTLGGGGIPPDQQASIALTGEGTISGDLYDAIESENFVIREEIHDPTHFHRFASGHTQASPVWEGPRSVFRFDAIVTGSEITALRSFWDSHLGHEIGFTWTQDGESQINAGFVRDSLEVDEIGPGAFHVRFEVVELQVS